VEYHIFTKLPWQNGLFNYNFRPENLHESLTTRRGQGELAGPLQGHHVAERQHWWPKGGSSYSPGVVDADYSLASPKTVCAWQRATSYKKWPCYTEHSGSKGANLEKQSPILRCKCCAQGMNGSG